ncbi:class I SAM-dependent methyltransferase [Fervidobacterium sp. 2310opik-2]|uniref:class I SAM-dependent methyltransferase n=1 Tax=Fervidobacterium sp. 2310opik-2 TaxID=1755815 RepID=UPI0013DEBF84|nr:class I SAM-dependent methyltransferase [Fervidobacterium sp. 2310opik-2]KAF2962322.1 methyltransferase type 12 [Fervidobacterium sp. 2310opik-2]
MRHIEKSYEYYNSIAHIYDEMYLDKYWENAKKQIKYVLKSYISDFSDKKVIDIGAGTGQWSQWFVQNGAQVVLVEPAWNMLEIAKEKLKNYSEKCTFICEKAENIQLDEKFDVIFLFGDVLSYVENIEKVLNNIKKLSKDGTYIFGTVDNFYSYLRDVIIYGDKRDYEYLKKYKKLPIGSQYGTFISRSFSEEDLIEISKNFSLELVEVSALGIFSDETLNFKYGKYLTKEAEHLLFVMKNHEKY